MLALVPQGSDTASIKFHDCSSPSNRHELDLTTACHEDTSFSNNKYDLTILQTRGHNIYNGYRCKVVRSTLSVFCGAFSHMKVISVPEIEINEPITASECYTAARRGRYTDHTGRTRDVQLDGITIFAINDLGVIHEDGGNIDCEGEDAKVSGEIVHQVVKLSQYKVEVRKEKYLHQGDRLEAVLSRIKLPASCSIEDRHCSTDTETYLYNSKINCKFVKIKTIKVRPENNLLVDHSNKLLFKKGLAAPLPAECGLGEYFLTEYSNLYLTNASLEFELVKEVDLAAFVNSRSDYTVYLTETHLATITRTVQSDLCHRRLYDNMRKDGKVFRLNDKEFAVSRGDVLSVFTCPTKEEEIADSPTCWDKIPLVRPGRFVNPATRLLSLTANQVSCESFPLIVKSAENVWIKIGPSITIRKAPPNETIIDHHALQHEDMSQGGLYSAKELSAWEEHINFGEFAEAVSEQLASGVCSNEGKCHSRSHTGSQSYDLNRLVAKTSLMDPLGAIKDFIHTYGGAAALFVLCKFLFETVLSIVLIALTYFKFGLTAARNLIKTLFCFSLTSHKKMKRRMVRYEIPSRMSMRNLPDHGDFAEDFTRAESDHYSYLRSPLAQTAETELPSDIASTTSDPRSAVSTSVSPAAL